MAKYQVAVVLLLVALSIFSCEAERPKTRFNRNRQLARQVVEEPVTPYPSADELKPEIPFEEAAIATEDTVIVEGEIVPADEAADNKPISDDVNGTPDVTVFNNTPDEVYGPPEIDANQLPADVALARQRQARLVQARRQAAYRQARLAKLSTAKAKRTA